MAIETFSRPDDDPAYQDWLATHPEGYVINVGRSAITRYARLHHATCDPIKELHGRGTTFTGQWVKLCSTSLAELDEWALQRRGAPVQRCATCWPQSTAGTA